MKRKILVFMSSLLAILIIHVPAFAKGDTVKITLTNLHSGTQMELTDYAAVRRFEVWGNLIIDWSKGTVAAPTAALARYQVKFYEGCKISEYPKACHSEETSLAYVVTYVHDPLTKRGYVYLPAKDDEFVDVNVRSIYRGVEGNWFVASEEWQSFVLPLIERSAASR
jgi:hypothetical protein